METRRISDRAIAQAFWEWRTRSNYFRAKYSASIWVEERARELDATAAPVVVVTDAMVEAFCLSYWKGDWPYDKTEAERELCNELRASVRKALTAALAGD